MNEPIDTIYDYDEELHEHPEVFEIVETIDVSDEEAAAIFGSLFDNDDRAFVSKAQSTRQLVSRNRAFPSLRRATIDKEKRAVELSLSSEIEVDRWFGREVLVHSADAIDMEFMSSGAAPLLLDHDLTRQIGVVELVRLDGDKKLRARVRFGRSALAQEVFQDVEDGIRQNVSVGYRVNKMVLSEQDDEKGDLYRVTGWSPYEVSIVSIPADTSVGIGRGSKAASSPSIITRKEETKMSDATRSGPGVVTQDSAPDLDKIRVEAAERAAKAAAADASRNAKEIIDLAVKHNCRDLGDKAIGEGMTVAEFRGALLDKLGDKPIKNNDVGLSRKERSRFSILKLSRALANPSVRAYQDAARLELEASQAAQDARGFSGSGVTIPTDILKGWRSDVGLSKRDLNITTGGDGKELIDEDFRASEFIDVLRNQTSVMRAGARMLTGLNGNVAIPKKTSASSAGWIATEGGAAGESDPQFGQVTLAPKVVGAFTDATRLMMQQSSLDVEALIRDDLAQGIALAIDLGGLEGTAADGQPRGVLNTSGINTVTAFAAAVPTFAETVTLETALAEDNALIGNLGYITDAATFGGMKTRTKDAGSGMFVIENDEANGYPIYRSQQATAGNLYFGNWQDLLIGMWDGLDILVDPYTASNTGTVRIVALQTVDVAVRHAVSFALGNDTEA